MQLVGGYPDPGKVTISGNTFSINKFHDLAEELTKTVAWFRKEWRHSH
jgi:hypothetical protein